MSVNELIVKLQDLSAQGHGDFAVQFETGGAAYNSDITTIEVNVKRTQILFEQGF